MNAIIPYMGRELMPRQQDSEEHMQVDWIILAPALITVIVSIGLIIGLSVRHYKNKRLLQAFKQWTVDSTMQFHEHYSEGRNPLQIAAEVNNVALVRHLLKNGNTALFHEDRLQNTALHYAAAFSQLDIVQLIAEQEGLSRLPQNEFHQTPLHIAGYRAKNPAERKVLTYLLGKCTKEDQLVQDRAGNTYLNVLMNDRGQAFCFKRKMDYDQDEIRRFADTLKIN